VGGGGVHERLSTRSTRKVFCGPKKEHYERLDTYVKYAKETEGKGSHPV